MKPVKWPTTRHEAEALDRADDLTPLRDRFDLPDTVIYLDGNSLGPRPRVVGDRVRRVIEDEWGADLIASWNRHDWIGLPQRVAAQIASIIGAAPGEVAVGDSTSVNLFKLAAIALDLRPGCRVILTEEENFPTDVYVTEGLVRLVGNSADLRVVPRRDLAQALRSDVAVLMLTHVDFRSGFMHDMAAWTRAAHEAGALALWDLAHSAGAVPLDLRRDHADLAVGCGYKYLNGGPGAPAFAWIAERHLDQVRTPIQGWMGHAEPFAFDLRFRPTADATRLAVGTPPILSMTALECGVEIMAGASMAALRRKSVALTEWFIHRTEERCRGLGLELASPRDPERRGSQVSFRHQRSFAVMQALIQRKVIGDFREPDLLRFGLAPAYVRFVDVWDAVEVLHEILHGRLWDRPEYRVRARVT
jgi:kynureninase